MVIFAVIIADHHTKSNKAAHLTAVHACSYRMVLVGFVRVSYWKWPGMILTAVGDLRRSTYKYACFSIQLERR